MGRNRQLEENQRVKAYLVRGIRENAFWCNDSYQKTISTDFGQPRTDGERVLITESNLDFRINDQVKINGELLLIESINFTLKTNRNSLRGAPSYIKRLGVK
jgi:uncharacterized Zn finger protein